MGIFPVTISYTLKDIDQAVVKFWAVARDQRIIAFSGGLGAGKTTFIHYLCDMLGVEDVVSSPTFALINEYHFFDREAVQLIYHLDWYRLKNSEEAFNAGMEECIDQARAGKAYCFIEWPEKAPDLLCTGCLHVSIDVLGETEREMTVTMVSPQTV